MADEGAWHALCPTHAEELLAEIPGCTTCEFLAEEDEDPTCDMEGCEEPAKLEVYVNMGTP